MYKKHVCYNKNSTAFFAFLYSGMFFKFSLIRANITANKLKTIKNTPLQSQYFN